MFSEFKNSAVSAQTLNQRLSSRLEDIVRTETKWFDGSLRSINDRRTLVADARAMCRQVIAGDEDEKRTFSAMEIEHNLGVIASQLETAANHFVSDEVLDAQRETPHFSVNASEV